MQRILSKRVLRDIRETCFGIWHCFPGGTGHVYGGGYCGSCRDYYAGDEGERTCPSQRGRTVWRFVPLTEKRPHRSRKRCDTAEGFSLDFHLGQSTFRVYQARESVDLFVPAEGEEIPAQGEILLEQHYAENMSCN